jgi:hypothetical protein
VVEAKGCPVSEIAIIYMLKNPESTEEPLPILLENAFSSKGAPQQVGI